MSSKTLSTIQTLSKIAKILSKIVFIFCIVGFCGCIVGMICLRFVPGNIFVIGDVTIHGIIENSAGLSMGTMYASMTAGLFLCAGEAVVAKFAEVYFRHELAAGTPFSFAGAKELLRLGILTICVPVGALVACNIAYNIINHVMENVADMHLDSYQSVGIGVMFILISLLCKHGAELQDNTSALPEASDTL